MRSVKLGASGRSTDIATSQLAETATRAARAGGDYLFEAFRRHPDSHWLRISAKQASSRHDRESERRILEVLRREHPEVPILSEESGGSDLDTTRLWVVDPLDGSRNYVNGNPFFAVSIALVDRGQPVVGVIYAPRLGDFVVAVRGQGAYRDDQRLRVSEHDRSGTLYVVGCDGAGDREAFARLTARATRECLDFRKVGSAAIEGILVASGQADGFFGLAVSCWDTAAAALVVEEAGGLATDFKGAPWTPHSDDVILSSRAAHDAILHIVAEGSD